MTGVFNRQCTNGHIRSAKEFNSAIETTQLGYPATRVPLLDLIGLKHPTGLP